MNTRILLLLYLFSFSIYAQLDSATVSINVITSDNNDLNEVTLHCKCNNGSELNLFSDSSSSFKLKIGPNQICQISASSPDIRTNIFGTEQQKYFHSEKSIIEFSSGRHFNKKILLEPIITSDCFPFQYSFECNSNLKPENKLINNGLAETLFYNPSVNVYFQYNIYADTCNVKPQIDSLRSHLIQYGISQERVIDSTINYRIIRQKDLPSNWDTTFAFQVGDTINKTVYNQLSEKQIELYYPLFSPLSIEYWINP